MRIDILWNVEIATLFPFSAYDYNITINCISFCSVTLLLYSYWKRHSVISCKGRFFFFPIQFHYFPPVNVPRVPRSRFRHVRLRKTIKATQNVPYVRFIRWNDSFPRWDRERTFRLLLLFNPSFRLHFVFTLFGPISLYLFCLLFLFFLFFSI